MILVACFFFVSKMARMETIGTFERKYSKEMETIIYLVSIFEGACCTGVG
jgi:hypothetical protein